MANRNLELALRMRADLEQARRQLRLIEGGLDRVGLQGRSAGKGVRDFGQEVDRSEQKMQRLSSTVGRVRNLLAALGVTLAIRQMSQYADTVSSMESQLRLVTDGRDELNQAMRDTYRVSQETRQDLESTVNLYARMARSTEELNLTHEELLTLTRAINQSYIVSGASAQEAAASTHQLGQAMASGVLRGEELNSVLENSPRLARAIADGLGVTTGKLRELGQEGELTAEQVTRALLYSADSIDREFQQMERTVGQALQQLRNDLLLTFGGAETEGFVQAIDELRGIVSDPAFAQSMADLGTATATLVGWLAKGASAATDFAKGLGEEVAAAVNGIAPDDIKRLEARANEIRRILDPNQLDKAIRSPLWDRLEFFGPNGLVEYYDDGELQAELSRLEKAIKDYWAGRPPVPAVDIGSEPQSAARSEPPTLLPPATGGGIGEVDREYQNALKSLLSLNDGLKQQVATFGQGEAAVLEYRLTLGDLSDDVAKLGADGQVLADSIIQQAQDFEKLAEAKQKEAAAERERQQAQQQAEQNLQQILDQADPNRVLERQLQLIEELKQKFPEYAAALDQAAGQVRERIGEIDQGLLSAAEINAEFTYAASGALDSFARDIASGRDEIDSLRDAFLQFSADFLHQIAQMIIEQTIFNALKESGFAAEIAGITRVTTAKTTADVTQAASSVTAANTAAAGQAAAAAQTTAAWAPAATVASIGSFGAAAAIGLAAVLAALAASQAFRDGGYVTGPGTETSDSIPALLSNKEFVTRAAVVKQPGAREFLEDFNKRGMQALEEWAVVERHANGGLAGLAPDEVPSIQRRREGALITDDGPRHRYNGGAEGGAAAASTNIYNLLDSDDLAQKVLSTPKGERAVINIIRSQKGQIKTILG